MEAVNLTERADVVIGSTEKPSLSGGQKKRVSIGMELLADRPVMFLDEPTSGLDSVTTTQLCRLVRPASLEMCCSARESVLCWLFVLSRLLPEGLSSYPLTVYWLN